MKIQAYKVPAFLKQIPKEIKGFLFYGPEQGLVSEHGDELSKQLVDNPKDPFTTSYIDLSQLLANEVALDIELNEISMFSPQKLIRIRHADEKFLKYLESCDALLKNSQNFLIIEADDLSAKSKLRKFCEQHEAIAALPCYVEDHRQLTQIIIGILRDYQLQAERAAIEYLAIHLASNRVMLRSELEKIALYKIGDKETISLEDVKKCLSNQADTFLEDPIWQVMDGNVTALKQSFETLLGQGTSEVAVVRAALRHVYRLMICKTELDKGAVLDSALAKLRPPVFYKQKPAFTKQLHRYSANYLNRIFNRLLQLEFSLKQTNNPSNILMMYQLNQIAHFNKRF